MNKVVLLFVSLTLSFNNCIPYQSDFDNYTAQLYKNIRHEPEKFKDKPNNLLPGQGCDLSVPSQILDTEIKNNLIENFKEKEFFDDEAVMALLIFSAGIVYGFLNEYINKK